MEMPDATHSMEDCICIIVQGDGWQSLESRAFCLLLKPTDRSASSFKRIGCLLLSFEPNEAWGEHGFPHKDEFYTEHMQRRFDDLGWERRDLKLL